MEKYEQRVKFFMSECTNISKTNYTPDVIESLISDKFNENKETLMETIVQDIDDMNAEEIKEYIRTF